VPFPVAAWTGTTGGPDAAEPWWLPARDVSITDSWDPDPETLNKGDTARRIVTVEAQGMLAEGLPPRPVMRTRGIITFAGPVKRETIITPTGPVARATYQWDIKKGVSEVIPLDAIKIPWFDTLTRTQREAEIPARQIGGGLADREEDLKPARPASWPALAAAALAAFGLGLALIGFRTGPRTPEPRSRAGPRPAPRRSLGRCGGVPRGARPRRAGAAGSRRALAGGAGSRARPRRPRSARLRPSIGGGEPGRPARPRPAPRPAAATRPVRGAGARASSRAPRRPGRAGVTARG
jgi:hypothetical protein